VPLKKYAGSFFLADRYAVLPVIFLTYPMMGFKAFHSAKATIDGVETTSYDSRDGYLMKKYPLISSLWL